MPALAPTCLSNDGCEQWFVACPLQMRTPGRRFQVYGSVNSGFHTCDSDIDLTLSAQADSAWAHALLPQSPSAPLAQVAAAKEARLALLRRESPLSASEPLPIADDRQFPLRHCLAISCE